MIDLLGLIAFSLTGAMITFAVTGFIIAKVMPGINLWSRRFFMSLFAVLTLCMISLFADLLSYKDPNMVITEKIAIYFEYLLLTFPMPIFTAYLSHTCGEELEKSAIFRASIVIFIFFFILLGITQFTTFFYYVTPDNHFIRGEWHTILMAPMVILPLLNLIGVIRRKNNLPPKYYVAFLIYLLPLLVTLFIHIFFFSDMIIFIGVVISTISMFAIILYDQIEQHFRMQREIAQQRASIMVLQMRPHFIYNAMMSIYYLCTQNPQKAQQVTLDFTTYLRKNFNAIAGEDTISFSDELEHTRAYLAIEQVQFGDSLLVDYDTPHITFHLPPLTLQPIVENAVKHGMDPEYAPLRISIRTRKTDFGSEIVVEDDGHGFILDIDKPQTALDNIRQRLEIMCGGKMIIRPRDGSGTIVKLIIP